MSANDIRKTLNIINESEKDYPNLEDYLTPLKPVKEWVYDLYKVEYLDAENGDVVSGPYYNASSYEGHLESDIEERWPNDRAKFYRYDRVAENVGHPRSTGTFHGRPISEDGWTHGKRIAQKLGLIQ